MAISIFPDAVDFDRGTGMDRTVDGGFDEWSGGVRQGLGECDEVRRDAVWDVHHPWAGKPLFSGHMWMIPMCSLCIPAFPEFQNMHLSAGDLDIDRGNSGNHRTTFGHDSYPSRTSHVIS